MKHFFELFEKKKKKPGREKQSHIGTLEKEEQLEQEVALAGKGK